ncbi:hypothetical protein AMTRI_Chr07g29750 [Amborella trichopoda]|uniref:LOB domain-containing protein 29-like n=1 Tax=Amborella trichopoda TaxID=13333 RepID=UPI0005D33215|nr:LOB domain-containing protein 29-like [Amborella trichopoda]|eukprot:XP_011625889.1 LOB domain-containing protein 29-like [Amborella trichopoda]
MTGFGSPCGACKFLRRKCARGCIFAPYFCNEQGATNFAAIHKVFGASNVSKLLTHLPISDRSEAAVTISYEAQARLKDPIYGCVAHIFALQQEVVNLQAQLLSLKEQVAHSQVSTTSSPQFPYQSENPTFSQQSMANMSQCLSNALGNCEPMLYNGFTDTSHIGGGYFGNNGEELTNIGCSSQTIDSYSSMQMN